ncbi:MAG TPA: hypothetical protein VHB97_25300 [Polyangia bacterium]|nr:hypothetical protein [Polyangia bacterium]
MKWLVAVALALAAAGCANEESRFPVVVTTETDDGQPLPDLPVTVGKTPAGRTDANGKLKMRVVGKEGGRIAVTVATPKGYRAASTATAVVLRRLGDIEGGGGRPLPIEHVVKFAPLQRQYAVLVRAGIPGIPVETFGTKQAVTNDKGVAIFLYEGTPGDELQVKLVTDARPDLMPRNPTQSFLLATRSEAYLVKERFTAAKKAVHKKSKPSGPKRL